MHALFCICKKNKTKGSSCHKDTTESTLFSYFMHPSVFFRPLESPRGQTWGGWGSQKGCFLWSAWNWGRNGIFEFRSVKRMCLAVWEQFRLRRLQKEAAASLPPITLTRPIWSWNPVTRRSRSSAIHRTRSKLSVLEAVWIDRSKPLKWI